MFIINYKNIQPNHGSQSMKFDTNITSANSCPSSVISEEGCKDSMEY